MAAAAAKVVPEEGRDWAGGLPADVLMKVAGKVVAQTEAGWAAQLKEDGWMEWEIQDKIAGRKRNGNCLFVFARVCRGWRKAQLEVGGPLRTRVQSDVILPGSVALVKWALAEGCPRENEYRNIAHAAAVHGHLELMKWLCGEGGFAMDEGMMNGAARSGNLELVQWLRGAGCPWDYWTCYGVSTKATWRCCAGSARTAARGNPNTRNMAAQKLGYTDKFHNMEPEE